MRARDTLAASRALTAAHAVSGRAVLEVVAETTIVVDASASVAEDCARRAMRACTHCGPTTSSPHVTWRAVSRNTAC